MFNPLELKKRFVQSQIEKAFSDDIEKARYQVGQPHPLHPDWLWTEYAPGKFDWKSKNGRHWKNKGGSTQSSDVKPVTAKEFSKNKNAVIEMLKNCDSKTDSNGDKRYHCEFYALGKDRGSAWLKKSDIEAYLRSYDDAKITPIKSDNASKEQKFKQSFKDASDEVLQKVVDGKIQASSEEKKWAQDILDERKASDVKTKAAKKIINLLKVASSKYTDISKVVAWKTDRGNYYLDYDGAETGITVDKDVLSDKDFENAGVKVEGNHGSSSDNHSVKLSGSEYKVKDDNGKDVTFASYIPKSISNSDPRNKVAQKAGFKDYEEMRGYQEYVTTKNLLKKPSMQAKTKQAEREALEKQVAKYEKEHADVIAARNGGKKAVDSYASMDIKDAKKALVGKVVTLADYWPDGRGGSQDAIGEIKNVRLYGKNKTPIAEVVYPNGDEQMIRLDEIDDGKMKDSYKTAITIGDDKTKLDAIKKKIGDKPDKKKADLPFTGLTKHSQVIDYAKTIDGADFEEIDSGFDDKGSKAFRLNYSGGLKLDVDFPNNSEYVYTFRDKNGNSLYEVRSTRETDRTDWGVMLNPRKWGNLVKSNISKHMSQRKAEQTRYFNSYSRRGKSSDYDRYLNAKYDIERLNRNLGKVDKILQLL